MSKVDIPFNDWSKRRLSTGEKTATTRTDRYGEAGDWFKVEDVHGRIREYELTAVREVPLEVVAEEYHSREGCPSPKRFKRVWKEIHTNRGWEDDWDVFLHLFEEVDA